MAEQDVPQIPLAIVKRLMKNKLQELQRPSAQGAPPHPSERSSALKRLYLTFNPSSLHLPPHRREKRCQRAERTAASHR
jgi:hypothetical protein